VVQQNELPVSSCGLPVAGDGRLAADERIASAGLRRPLASGRRPLATLSPVRRGVTLMEVLISIFVLSVGLLGVAALIPLGGATILETSKADRAGDCGRAGLRQVKVRRMLDPQNWVHRSGSSTTNWMYSISGNYVSNSPDSGPRTPICIDPLFLAAPAVNFRSAAQYLPYDGSGGPYLERRTLGAGPHITDTATAMPYGQAEQIFRWTEDLSYDIPPDRGQRPLLLFFASGGNVTMDRSLGIMPASDGNYSWMFTVSPAGSERGNAFANKQLYTVSIVVFHKRSLAVPISGAVPRERFADVTVTSGYSGGDAILSVPQSSANSDWLNVKRNDWLMLVGTTTVRNGSTADSTMRVCRWYRVAGFSAAPVVNGTNWERHVALAGPDWDCYDTNNVLQATAILVDNVIGVYTTTTELDRSALWTRGY